MNIEEFNQQRYKQGDKVYYREGVYDVVSIDFDEQLFGIEYIENSETLKWVRCENVKYIPA